MQIARHWRLKEQRYHLQGSVCLKCGRAVFPPRPVCPFCAGEASIDEMIEITEELHLPEKLPVEVKP